MAELNGMQGNEIADDFIRKGASKGRWADAWDVFKSNFWKFVLLNLLVLVTFAPGIAVVYVRTVYITGLGSIYPFNAAAGFPFYPHESLIGLPQSVIMSADIMFYALLVVAGFFAAVGISGAGYCIRKLLQTHGEFNMKGFFHGVKVGYFNTLLPTVLFMVFVYSTILIKDWMDITIAVGGNKAGAITAYVFIIIATVLAGIYLLWVFSVGLSYRVKMRYLFRNSFILMIGSPLPTIFMVAFTMIPMWFILIGGFWRIIAYVFMIFLGFSFMLLSWLAYSQSIFDMYITPSLKTEKEAAQAKKSPKELAAEKEAEDKQKALELLAAGKSELIARPIMPVSKEQSVNILGKNFTRSSLSEVAAERDKLLSDVASYEKQHENDDVYKEYNKMFAEREKALQEPEDKKKKKKISADNLLK